MPWRRSSASRRAARRAYAARASARRERGRGVGDQRGRRGLQEMADPVDPGDEAPSQLVLGPRVAGDHGDAQVRAEDLGHRAHQRPPCRVGRARLLVGRVRPASDRWSSSTTNTSGNASKDLPERRGSLAVQARAGRVLRPRRAHHRPRAVRRARSRARRGPCLAGRPGRRRGESPSRSRCRCSPGSRDPRRRPRRPGPASFPAGARSRQALRGSRTRRTARRRRRRTVPRRAREAPAAPRERRTAAARRPPRTNAARRSGRRSGSGLPPARSTAGAGDRAPSPRRRSGEATTVPPRPRPSTRPRSASWR